MLIGSMNHCRAEERLPQGVYLRTEDGGRVLLPNSKVPATLQPGQDIEVFLYLDSEDRPVATTQKPLAVVGEFAVLEVLEVNQIGAFLDWGIDKDLLLPYRHQLGELRRGDRCVVYVLFDEASGRIVATEKLRPFFDRDTQDLVPGQKVELAAYHFQEEGVDCVVDRRFTGRLHGDPARFKLYIGDERTGYIQNIREDGKIDLSLSPIGYRAVMATADDLLAKLRDADGFLPLGDHSDPAEIQARLGLSKKAFKKLVGGLYREGLVELSPDGIRLCKNR